MTTRAKEIRELGNTGYLEVDANGNVGIGTASPANPLHLYANNTSELSFKMEQQEGFFEIGTNGNTTIFRNANGYQMFLNSAGNLGIGTLDADYKLTVAGDPGDDAITLLSLLHTDTNFGNGTGLNHAVNIEFNLPANRGGDTSARTAALIRGRKGAADWYTGSADSVNFQGQLAFYTRQDNVLTEQMVIDEDGNVGIGTTSPSVDLEVSSSSNPFILLKNTNSGSGLYIKADNDGDAELQTAGGNNTIIMRTTGVARTKLTSNGALLLNSTGYVKTDAAQTMTLGDGNSASAAGIDIIRGETLGGGTGPYIRMYHGPDSETQTEARISSVVGDLRIEADRGNVHGSTTIDFHIDGAQKASLSDSGILTLSQQNYSFKHYSGSLPALTANTWQTAFSISAVADTGLYILVFGNFEQSYTGGTQWSTRYVSDPICLHGGTSNDGELVTINLRHHGHAQNSSGMQCRLDYADGSHSWGRIEIYPTFNYDGTYSNSKWHAFKIADI